MMRRVINDMTLLAQEDNSALNIDNDLYNTMYYVGINDLYDGLQTASDLFVSSSTSIYDTIRILQMVAVLAVFLLSAVYLLLVLRTYLQLQHHEVDQVAGLLSQVPNELDVPSHVKKVLADAANKKKKRGRKGRGGGRVISSIRGMMMGGGGSRGSFEDPRGSTTKSDTSERGWPSIGSGTQTA